MHSDHTHTHTADREEQFEAPSIRVRSIDLGCCCCMSLFRTALGLLLCEVIELNSCLAHQLRRPSPKSADCGQQRNWKSNSIFCVCSDHIENRLLFFGNPEFKSAISMVKVPVNNRGVRPTAHGGRAADRTTMVGRCAKRWSGRTGRLESHSRSAR